MRQDEIGRKRDKRVLDPTPAHTRPVVENSEKKCKNIQKIKKQLSDVIFSQKGMRQDEIGRERDKRILGPNSAHTRPGGENSEKNAKIFKKLKNNFPVLFSAKTRDRIRQAEKEIKEFSTRNPLILDPGKKILKTNAKKYKKLKNNIPALFLAKTG